MHVVSFNWFCVTIIFPAQVKIHEYGIKLPIAFDSYRHLTNFRGIGKLVIEKLIPPQKHF